MVEIAITSETFYKTKAQILGDMIAQLQSTITDVYLGEDGVLRMIMEIESSQLEYASLANQILLEDMFVQTASFSALRLHGQQYGVLLREGTLASGPVRFEGDGGTYIPIGVTVVYDPGTGIGTQFFVTTEDGVIPNPGEPLDPTVAVGAGPGMSGDYEYAISFLVGTAGESMAGMESDVVSPSNQSVNITGISLGGPGTTARRVYRRKIGADVNFYRVAEITNNTVTTWNDTMSDATAITRSTIPESDTSNAIVLNCEALVPGTEGNVAVGTITVVSDGPGGITDVGNIAVFTGGTDQEDTESYRQRILNFLRAPQTGSVADLKVWAESISGVENASVFENDNLGTPTNGHATVRISGVGGTVPDAAIQNNVLTELDSRGIANVTYHVGTFTPVATNVTVDVTTDGTYTLGDITPGVQQSIIDYINNLPVGGTLYVSGIVDAVFGLAGVADVVVTVPSSNQTTPASSKRVPSVITVV